MNGILHVGSRLDQNDSRRRGGLTEDNDASGSEKRNFYFRKRASRGAGGFGAGSVHPRTRPRQNANATMNCDAYGNKNNKGAETRAFIRLLTYSAVIAPVGHPSSQAPQSMQTAASTTYVVSPGAIAPTGQVSAHAPQDTQASVIVCAMVNLHLIFLRASARQPNTLYHNFYRS